MDILLVNHYAGSPTLGMEYRPWYLAREWIRTGHRVRVVAADFAHVRSRQPAPATLPRLELVDGVEHLFLPTPPYQGNGLGRIRNMLAFVSALYRHSLEVTHGLRPGAVITSSTYPLDTWPARRIARAHGARLVHEVHDLWPLSPMEIGGMAAWHPFVMVMQAGENAAYRHSDAVVSMLPAAEPHMRSHGLAPGRFFHVPNGIDLGEWEEEPEPLPAPARQAIAGLRQSHPFLVGYAGAHGPANALDTLLDAAALLEGSGVGIALVGQGPEKDALRERAGRMGLRHVAFLDPIPKRAVPSLLGAVDATFIGIARRPLYRFGVSPNKLMDYMMAGKPVVCGIQDDAGNDMVRDADCGYSVPPDDPAAMAAAIKRVAALSPSEREAMGLRGRHHVEERHAYGVLARRFMEVLQG